MYTNISLQLKGNNNKTVTGISDALCNWQVKKNGDKYVSVSLRIGRHTINEHYLLEIKGHKQVVKFINEIGQAFGIDPALIEQRTSNILETFTKLAGHFGLSVAANAEAKKLLSKL